MVFLQVLQLRVNIPSDRAFMFPKRAHAACKEKKIKVYVRIECDVLQVVL